MKKIALFLTISCLYSFGLQAQIQGDVYRQYNDAPVLNNGKRLAFAWAGGLNNPQFAMADLNRDGRNDLVVYESYSDVVKTFICTAPGKYKYDSWYESSFTGVLSYIKLIDFNNDKIPDLIHRGQDGVDVSYGYYANNVLKFRHYKNVKYYSSTSKWTNVNVPYIDIPEMMDIDSDGDIDIFSYNWAGSQLIHYRNCRVEDNLPDDSISICLADECWGRAYQDFQREQFLGRLCYQDGVTCKGCSTPQAKNTHGSNTICFIDIDNDGDQDYFNGNQDYADIQFLYNGKAQFGVDSMVAQDTAWSSKGVTMKVPIFPAAFYLNVDHEGGSDLIFSSRAENTENHGVVYYKNVGVAPNKVFEYKTNTFLLDDMIDMGAGSYPLLYDFDKDGKKDLLVGSEGFYQYPANINVSKLALYRNTTVAKDSFSFELVTDDLLGLSSKNYQGIAPAVGDIDNDSLDDLVIGHTDGTFTFFKNTAVSDTLQPVWQLAKETMTDGRTGKLLKVQECATPCLYDIDGDGRKDLVSGSKTGQLVYFHNYGTFPGFSGFEHKTDSLGGINLAHIDATYFYSAPYIGSIDDDGNDYLMIGTIFGTIYKFTGFQNGANPANYTLLDKVYSYLDVGKRAAPAFANLDNDSVGLHELVVGNYNGGLSFYKQHFKVGINDVNKVTGNVEVFPNPSSDAISVRWEADMGKDGVSVHLISVTGQHVYAQKFGADVSSITIPLDNVPSGVYYCTVHTSTGKVVKPVSVIK